MDERNSNNNNNDTSGEKLEEVVLPGFRFHPTDEELVGFYLKRKVQHKPLSIELIKQLDIYKYDPWDLPKLAAVGEKEWYFYCPRDRKYRNSARPNRVTGAGFWKATGTDRPIYSTETSKCIGLKKSLVFYKGRAARGIKTDWMMHEFRLPSLSDISTPKRFLDKNIPPNDAWAICRIFKKANSNAQRALSHSWVVSSPLIPQTSTQQQQQILNHNNNNNNHVHTNNMCNTSSTITTSSTLHNHHHCNNINFKNSPETVAITATTAVSHPLDLLSYNDNITFPPSSLFTHHHIPLPPLPHHLHQQSLLAQKGISVNDASSLLLDMSNSVLGYGGLMINPPPLQENVIMEGVQEGATIMLQGKESSSNIIDESIRFSFNGFPLNLGCDQTNSNNVAWKSSMVWESSPCPSDISTSYSTNLSVTLN